MTGLFQLIASDLRAKAQRMYGSQSARAILKTLAADGTITMLMYRFMQASQKWHLIPLAMLFNKLISLFGQCIIGRHTDFGPAFVMLYSNGIMINGKVKGGSHITLVHQIMIGEARARAPILGNHIYISSGAKIFGPIKVGNHTTIGPNTVVLSDVPDGATMFGVPAQIIWRSALPAPEKPRQPNEQSI